MCVLFIYTISISIICVSQAEPSLTASNQQIHDFYKCIIFLKRRHCGNKIFDIIGLFIYYNKGSWCEHVTGGINIYLDGCISVLAVEYVVYLCVLCVWYQMWVPVKKPHVTDFSELYQSCQLFLILICDWRQHFFLIKIKQKTRFCRAKIQLKFSAPQGKMRISRLPDSLKLQLKREKCILSSFAILMYGPLL